MSINNSINNILTSYSTTATAGGTTTLTATSNAQQYFTGTLAQTVTMPVTSTLTLGQKWQIVNQSTGTLTVQSSGGNTISVVPPNGALSVICILTSGTTASSWYSFSTAKKFATYLPVATFTTPGDLSVAYATQQGSYVLENGLCTVQLTVKFTPTYTTSSGNLTISLPVAPDTSNGVQYGTCATSTITYPAGTSNLISYASSQQAQIIGIGTGAAGSFVTTTNVVTAVQVQVDITMSYFI